MQTIQVKNMVCGRCVNAVKTILTELNISYNSIQLGKLEIAGRLNKNQEKVLKEQLKAVGFEWLDSRESQLINHIKSYLIEWIHYEKHQNAMNISQSLSKALQTDYSTLSKLFSKVEGVTIEKYIVRQKVEKVKELLSYDEKTIAEIAFEMNYSSAAHLSSQFKRVTGMTPTQFKKLKTPIRQSLDEL